MAITFNTKTFSLQSQEANATEYLKDGGLLNEPYRVRQSRVLPKTGVKNTVLRGTTKLTRSWVDANGDTQVAVVTFGSSIPASIPSAVLTDLEADAKAAMAVDAAVADVLFRGKVYNG